MGTCTGYTQKLIEEGQDFKDFVLTCARAFGACVELRDEPLSSDIPEFKESNYHKKEISKSEKLLCNLLKMTEEEQRLYGVNFRNKEIKNYTQYLKEADVENRRIEKMITQVKEWKPPTSEHQGLKVFMLDQLNMVIRDLSYYKDEIRKINNTDVLDYYYLAVESAKESIEYHKEQFAEEVDRVKNRNKWIEQLKNSL